MRKVTKEIVSAFLNRQAKSISNTHTDGASLFLHGNLIAQHTTEGDLYISAAGWLTNTTKERLNGLPNVSICQRQGVWYLNGQAWNGDWIKV